jgi:hypothetical protein
VSGQAINATEGIMPLLPERQSEAAPSAVDAVTNLVNGSSSGLEAWAFSPGKFYEQR